MCQLQTENPWINAVLVQSNYLFLVSLFTVLCSCPFSCLDHVFILSLTILYHGLIMLCSRPFSFAVHLFICFFLHAFIIMFIMYLHFLCFFMLCVGCAFCSMFDQKIRKSATKYKYSRMNNKRNGKECKQGQIMFQKIAIKTCLFYHTSGCCKKNKKNRSRGPRQNCSAETSTYRLFVVES